MTCAIGVDLAQARDHTVLACVSSYNAEPEDETGRRRQVRHLTLTHLEKLTPGLPYPQQAELIASVAEKVSTSETPTLWIDATGVGRPVTDLVRQASPFPVRAVTIGSGNDVVKHGAYLTVPKVDLVGTLKVALSTRRLHAAPGLSFADELDQELRAFSYELSPTGRPLYEGKGTHDDFVIALALAVFGAGRGGSAKAFLEAVAGAAETRTPSPSARLPLPSQARTLAKIALTPKSV